MKRTFFFLLSLTVVTTGMAQTRVGIGTTTPLIDFDVLGDTIGMRSNTTWDNLWFHVDGSSANISASGADNGLRFRVGFNTSGTYGNGQSLNTVMTLLPSGRLGLGVITPYCQFTNTTKNTIASDGSGGNPGSFAWAANQPGYAAQIYNEGTISTSSGLSVKVLTNTAKILDLSLGPQETFGYPIMNVWADGKIGIGTAIPATPMDLVGGTSKTGIRVSGGKGQTDCDGLLILKDSSSNTAANGNNELIEFLNAANGLIGSVSRVAGTNAISFNTTSDTRLKTGIHPTRYGLNDLMAIEVADYQYKGTSNAPSQTGFLAQQLYSIFPEAVTKGNDADVKQPYMVDYSRLTPLLVKAVQELKARVDALQKENESLKASATTELEARLKRLEAWMANPETTTARP